MMMCETSAPSEAPGASEAPDYTQPDTQPDISNLSQFLGTDTLDDIQIPDGISFGEDDLMAPIGEGDLDL